MPLYEITDPKGQVHRVDAPVNATREQIIARAQQQMEDRRTYDPTRGMGTGERLLAGAGMAVDSTLRGIKQRGGELLNRVGLVSDKTIADMQGNEAAQRQVNAPLLNTTAGNVGNVLGNVGMFSTTAFIPGANTYTGAALIGATAGAAQPTVEGESALRNTAIGAGGGMAGKVVGDTVSRTIANKYGAEFLRRADQRTLNAERDAILREAKTAGYVVPPTTVNPSAVNRLLESTAGKINTAQQASYNNQSITNALARRALGVADDAPLTDTTFRRIIAEANQPYDALKAVRQFNWTPEYRRSIQSLANQAPDSVLPNPANAEIAKIITSLDQKTFTGRELVSTIRQLRREASLAYKAGNKTNDAATLAVAQAKQRGADALEQLAEDNLSLQGAKNLIEPFRAARIRLAKLNDVERSASESGDVSAKALARLLAKGSPLTDELRTIARTAQTFDKAMQDPSKIGSPVVSNLRASMAPIAGMLGYGAMGPIGTLAAAAPLVTPAIRSMILSRPYQALMASPQISNPQVLALAHRLMQNQGMRNTIPAMGALTSMSALPPE